MFLVVAATEIEMAPFLEGATGLREECRNLVTGVGPVETALRLTRFLSLTELSFEAVIQFGIGGAYLQPDALKQPQLLDICLAEKEVAGDFGICMEHSMDYLDSSLTGDIAYTFEEPLVCRCESILSQRAIPYYKGVFITVNGISGTTRRGEMLRARWNGLCENMEGASLARVCEEFSLPCTQLRCISNFVEDRDPSRWRLQEACQKAAYTAIKLIEGMS